MEKKEIDESFTTAYQGFLQMVAEEEGNTKEEKLVSSFYKKMLDMYIHYATRDFEDPSFENTTMEERRVMLSHVNTMGIDDAYLFFKKELADDSKEMFHSILIAHLLCKKYMANKKEPVNKEYIRELVILEAKDLFYKVCQNDSE